MARKRLYGAAADSHRAKRQKQSEPTEGSSSQFPAEAAEAATSAKAKGKERAEEEPEAEPTLLPPHLSEKAVFPQLPEVSDDDMATAFSRVDGYKPSKKKKDKTREILLAFLKFLPDDGKKFFVHDVLALQSYDELVGFALKLRNLLARPREYQSASYHANDVLILTSSFQ